jgi:hypothetical protein
VRDREHSHPPLDNRTSDSGTHQTQRVDVESGVELVEHGVTRTQHRELHRLVSFALPARQVDVHRAVGKPTIEADFIGFCVESRRELTVAQLDASRSKRLAQRRDDRHTRDFDRVLHRQEQPGLRSLPRGPAQQFNTVEAH